MSHAVSCMAISKAPSWEIRALVMHVYPNGIKGFGDELASNLQGRLNTTISVI